MASKTGIEITFDRTRKPLPTDFSLPRDFSMNHGHSDLKVTFNCKPRPQQVEFVITIPQGLSCLRVEVSHSRVALDHAALNGRQLEFQKVLESAHPSVEVQVPRLHPSSPAKSDMAKVPKSTSPPRMPLRVKVEPDSPEKSAFGVPRQKKRVVAETHA